MIRAQKIQVALLITLLIAELSQFHSNGRAGNFLHFDIPPYLTELTHEKAVINWRLKNKGISSIRYYMGSGKKSITIDSKSSIQHKVILYVPWRTTRVPALV